MTSRALVDFAHWSLCSPSPRNQRATAVRVGVSRGRRVVSDDRDMVVARSDRKRGETRWSWRVVLLLAIVAALFTFSLAAGTAGRFSSATRRLGRRLQDPATRLAAATSLADQFAASFAGNHPTLPGARDDQTCPGAYAARASALIGALTPVDAAGILRSAAHRLSATGWRVDQTPLDAGVSRVTGRNRRGLDVVVNEQPGDQLTTIEVTVTVSCPAPARSTTTSTSSPAASSAVGG